MLEVCFLNPPVPLLRATILRGGGRETDGFQYTILLLSAVHL